MTFLAWNAVRLLGALCKPNYLQRPSPGTASPGDANNVSACCYIIGGDAWAFVQPAALQFSSELAVISCYVGRNTRLNVVPSFTKNSIIKLASKHIAAQKELQKKRIYTAIKASRGAAVTSSLRHFDRFTFLNVNMLTRRGALIHLWKLILRWREPASASVFCSCKQTKVSFIESPSQFSSPSLFAFHCALSVCHWVAFTRGRGGKYRSLGTHPQRRLSDLFRGWHNQKRCKNRKENCLPTQPPTPTQSSVVDVKLLLLHFNTMQESGN